MTGPRHVIFATAAALLFVLAPAWFGAATFDPSRARWLPEDSPLRVQRPLLTRHLPTRGRAVMRDEAGWPFRSLACEYALSETPRGEMYCTKTTWAIPIELPPPGRDPGSLAIRDAAVYSRALPLRPLPLGFMLDFVAGLAVYLIAVAALTEIRRARVLRGPAHRDEMPKQAPAPWANADRLTRFPVQRR